MNRQSSLIFRLPAEVFITIIEYLEFPDNAHLRATSRFFALLIPTQSSHYLDLAAADDSAWAIRGNRLACAYCARMRPASAFTDRQKTRDPTTRMCFECSIRGDEQGLYPSGGWVLPINMSRTHFTNERRKITVDQKESGTCFLCHNHFLRWGQASASRGICMACELEPGGDEDRRMEKDLFKIRNKVGHVSSRAYGGQLWDIDGYVGCICEMDCTCEDRWDRIAKGQVGERGVKIKSREEVNKLLYGA